MPRKIDWVLYISVVLFLVIVSGVAGAMYPR